MGKTMTAKEVVKALESQGFVAVAHNATAHKKMRHTDGRWTIVPMHTGDIDVSLLKKIERQTGVKIRELG